MEPAFQIDSDVIRIVNGRGRSQSICLGVLAGVIALLPLVPADIRGVDTDPSLYLLGAFLCLSAAFWWSQVTIDPTADEVRIVRRWGLSRSVRRWALSSFESVALVVDSDGQAEVYLRGKGADLGLSWNHSRALVWGRPYDQTRQIAATLAEHLALRLDIPA
jgi:hypothetical protein